ncbi:MAG: SpoIIE family protein phosphatase [Leptospiraceae bacterium]|nr:SpoIIE family protein phosphatase [Leptospiraceae bacterium]
MLENFFLFFACSYFLFRIPKKTTATYYLSLINFFGVFVSFGYAMTQGIYANSAAFRLMTLFAIPIHFLLYPQFSLHFPKLTNPGLARFLLWLELLITFVVLVYGAVLVFQRPYSFNFDGEYYEFDYPDFLKVYGLVTLSFIFISLFVSLWRVFTLKDRDRYYHILILVSLIIALLIPGLANVANKLGLVPREVYLVTVSLFTLTGMFMLLVAFINHTQDKTTFMVKILGVSFLVFMVIYNFLAFFILEERERSYQILKKHDVSLAIEDIQDLEDLSYVISYRSESGALKLNTIKEEFEREFVDNIDLQKAYYLNFLFQKVKEQKDIENFWNAFILSRPFKQERSFIQPFHELLLRQLNEDFSSENVKKVNFEIQNLLMKNYSSMSQVPAAKFKKYIEKLLEDKNPKSASFRKAIIIFLKDHVGLEGDILKTVILQFYKPFPKEGDKIFRECKKTGKHFIAFIKYDVKKETYYEVGFQYRYYRKYIHEQARIFVYLLIFALILIFGGTPIFLSRALLLPLQELLNGLRRVKKGNLNVEVAVHVQDEIGFLSTSFNSMVKSIRESKVKLEEYSNQLEEKVEERTKELLVSLSEVQKLKVQQDGDYFLTSLLLKPFDSNYISAGDFIVDSYVKQKKEFQFRGRNYEIGGDICVAYKISLKGKEYLVFLNADAMGKSIQGAGGILVLGSVFQSIIQRTQTYSYMRDLSPEKWLKSGFKEMHKVFEGFDGSMLISIIFGLIDVSSGFLYYINAEHPWIILYRDSVAEFIEKELYFRKLGTPGLNTELFISTFQLQRGDMLIIGSDGKDDLVMEKTEDSRIINEDENLFLRNVEQVKGDVKKMYSFISEKYELMDDFSVLSIQYLDRNNDSFEDYKYEEKAREIEKSENLNYTIQEIEKLFIEIPNNLYIASRLIKLYMRKKDYKSAAKISHIYLNRNEADTSVLLKASYCLKMNKELEEAIEIAERIRLREPYNLRNLIHLADMYAYIGIYEKANKMIQKAVKLEPDNQAIQKILTTIEKLKKKG